MKPYFVPVTIASSASISDAVDLQGFEVAGVIMPKGWTAANLTFQASHMLDGTFANVYNDGGNEVVVTAAESRAIGIGTAAAALAPFRFLKVRSGTAGTAVEQENADKTLIFVLKG